MDAIDKTMVIDRHAACVRDWLEALVRSDEQWAEILTVAKGRHVLGHYEYGDKNLFEWSDGKVEAAVVEELADAVVYLTWIQERIREAAAA